MPNTIVSHKYKIEKLRIGQQWNEPKPSCAELFSSLFLTLVSFLSSLLFIETKNSDSNYKCDEDHSHCHDHQAKLIGIPKKLPWISA